jgi:hypothetical protein
MWLYKLNAMNHCLDWIHDFARSFFVVFVVQGSRFVVFLDFLDISWTLDLLVGRSCWFPKLTVRCGCHWHLRVLPSQPTIWGWTLYHSEGVKRYPRVGCAFLGFRMVKPEFLVGRSLIVA